MLALKNTYKNVFLFLLIWTPAYIYSGNQQPSNQLFPINCFNREVSDFIDMGTEDGRINQGILTESNEDLRAASCSKHPKLSYYLYISDFISSFIQIPTSNVSGDSSTISSAYLAGRAPIYNRHNEKVGTCSASFLCMQNADGIFTDISNYLSVDNGLIISWLTPTTLLNLELDSIVHSMVTECLVLASTKIGFNPFYGKSFNMIVSSDDQKIYFKLYKL